jgi:hypothetical protein
MAKRFTDTAKWSKPFVRALQAPYKLLWLYILDECDHAGIWQVDIEVAQIRIGEKIEISEAIKEFGDKIQVLEGGQKWFIMDFVEFQYGELNPENRAHNSVLAILRKYKIKPLVRSLQGRKDMDKDKDKDKEGDFKKIENDFWPIIQKWLDYKKARKETYKSQDSINAFETKLRGFSDNNFEVASRIVDQSMANNWAGIFALKNNDFVGQKNGITKIKIENPLARLPADFIPPTYGK